jgi:hypothetical protein
MCVRTGDTRHSVAATSMHRRTVLSHALAHPFGQAACRTCTRLHTPSALDRSGEVRSAAALTQSWWLHHQELIVPYCVGIMQLHQWMP